MAKQNPQETISMEPEIEEATPEVSGTTVVVESAEPTEDPKAPAFEMESDIEDGDGKLPEGKAVLQAEKPGIALSPSALQGQASKIQALEQKVGELTQTLGVVSQSMEKIVQAIMGQPEPGSKALAQPTGEAAQREALLAALQSSGGPLPYLDRLLEAMKIASPPPQSVQPTSIEVLVDSMKVFDTMGNVFLGLMDKMARSIQTFGKTGLLVKSESEPRTSSRRLGGHV